MDAYIIYVAVAMLGCGMATVVPYFLKARSDSSIKFDVNYFYTLCLSACFSALIFVPEDTSQVTGKMLVLVFFASLGANFGSNKIYTATK